MTNYLGLKWGTLKSWQFEDPKCLALIEKLHETPRCMSVALQQDTQEEKLILCELVDAVFAAGGEVYNDWTSETYQIPEDAKLYILNYPKP